MILVYPLLVAAAAVAIWRTSRHRTGGRWGFAAWCAAGVLFAFSLLTGLSIGIFLLPALALGMLLALRLAPSFRAAAGFPLGVAAVVLPVALAYA